MRTNPPGGDGPAVTLATVGTMAFGRQNTEAEAHDPLDRETLEAIDAIHLRFTNPAP